MKTCTRCKETKQKILFSKNSKSKDGLQSHCKMCVNAYAADYRATIDPGRLREYNAVYYTANYDKIRAQHAEYRASNMDKRRDKAYAAAYYAANSVEIKARVSAYRAANIEKEKARSVKWRKDNPDKRRAHDAIYRAAHTESGRIYRHNRRARIAENGGKLSPELVSKLIKLQRGKCACCGLRLGDNYHMDHIMPIALGGTNEDWNIQLLRATCNMQKHAKHPVDFMQQRGFLL